MERDQFYTLELRNPNACRLAFTVGLGPDGKRSSLVIADNLMINGAGKPFTNEEFMPAEGGQVLIAFSAAGTSFCTGFDFVVLRSTNAGLAHDSTTLDPNNSSSTASVITVGMTVRSGLIDDFDIDDYYRAPIVAGTRYAFEFLTAGCRVVLKGDLGERGTRQSLFQMRESLATIYPYEPVGPIEFTAPENGFALLRIARFLSTNCPQYEFVLRQL